MLSDKKFIIEVKKHIEKLRKLSLKIGINPTFGELETSWEKELRKEYFRGAGIQVFDLNKLSMDEIRIKVNEPFSSTNDPCPTKFPKILSRLIHLIGAEAKEYIDFENKFEFPQTDL